MISSVLKVVYDCNSNTWYKGDSYNVFVDRSLIQGLEARVKLCGVDLLNGLRGLILGRGRLESAGINYNVYVYSADMVQLGIIIVFDVMVGHVSCDSGVRVLFMDGMSLYLVCSLDYIYACAMNKSLLEYTLSNINVKIVTFDDRGYKINGFRIW